MQVRAYPELSKALASMLDKIDAVVRRGAQGGVPIRMYLAGGLAVNFYCGTRYTEDVDASFSARVLLPVEELSVQYTDRNGDASVLYFDGQYSPTFSLMHEDYPDAAVEWPGIGNEERTVKLFVLSPVDLAVSKVARFSEQDREDILALARERLVTPEAFRRRAEEALLYYVGNTEAARLSIDLMVARLQETR